MRAQNINGYILVNKFMVPRSGKHQQEDPGTMMPKLTDRLRLLGERQRSTQWLPRVALEVAEAAKKGEIDETDATSLYMAYFRASTGTHLNGAAASAGIRVNASKLRQVIKCADPVLMRRVVKMWNKAGGKVRPLYPVMVDVARLAARLNERPSDRQIKALIKK